MKVKKLFFLILFISIAAKNFAQTVIVTDDANYTAGQPSSVLDIKSTNKGLLVPRVTQAQRIAISAPADGLLVYQTDATKGFYNYNGNIWIPIGQGTATVNQWNTTGNTGTTAGVNFIGTLDSKDFVIKTNNNERFRIESAGNSIFGTATQNGKITLSNTITAGNSDIFTNDNVPLRIANSGSGQTGASIQLRPSSENYLLNFEGRGGFRYFSRVSNTERFKVEDTGELNSHGTGNNSLAGKLGIGTTTPSTSLHIKSSTAGDAGLRLENLTNTSTATTGAAVIGVDGTGKVVRTKTPVHYNGTGATATVDAITKIWTADVANTSTGTQTITIPSNVGFTSILNLLVTIRMSSSQQHKPMSIIISNTTSSVTYSIYEHSGNLHTDTNTRIYIRAAGN